MISGTNAIGLLCNQCSQITHHHVLAGVCFTPQWSLDLQRSQSHEVWWCST